MTLWAWIRWLAISLPVVLSFANLARAEETAEVTAVVVGADRVPDPEAGAPFTFYEFEQRELQSAPESRLDDLLRAQVPGFSLFRRDSSRTANPTTQGVTLRNFGPSGAGRTLVLLDGIPLNDPFAGYVLWSQVPPDSLQSVVVQPGGGAGVFGNAALAGTIYLSSKGLDANNAYAMWSAGTSSTFEGAAGGALANGAFALAASADGFSTGGYPVIAESQRGRVDTNASSQAQLVNLAGQWRPNDTVTLRLNGRWFEDDRANGTFYTRNSTVGGDGSAIFNLKRGNDSELQLSVYGQARKYESRFSSVNATRTVETPAQDQYEVPADAIGGSAVWSQSLGSQQFTLGADARYVDGETNENFFWNGNRFTRRRQAGGEQVFAGVFVDDTWTISPAVLLLGGLRFDHWDLIDGFLKESVIGSGAFLTNQRFRNRSGNEINGRLGGRFDLSRQLTLRLSGYTGFRVPTLNELYRPFRVGNDVTQANSALQPEHSLGSELALDWRPLNSLTLTGTFFMNWLEDAVSNVTIGTAPNGGSLRQRQNLDLVFAPGGEAEAKWKLADTFSITAGYLFTHPEIARARDHALVGNLLAQTPEHVVTAGIEWQPAKRWSLRGQMRYADRQFEDDQNSRVLPPYTCFDAALSFQASPNLTVRLRAENLFDTEIVTGVSAAGVRSTGEPRLVSLDIRWQL